MKARFTRRKKDLLKTGSILALCALPLWGCHSQAAQALGPEDIVTRTGLTSAYEADGHMVSQALLGIAASPRDDEEILGWLEDVGHSVRTILVNGSPQDSISLFRVLERGYPAFRESLAETGASPLRIITDPLYPATGEGSRQAQRLGALFLLLPEMPRIARGTDAMELSAGFLELFMEGIGESGDVRGFCRRTSGPIRMWMRGPDPLSERSLSELFESLRENLG